jgi:poly-D-alanine transfer protein DltD
MRAAGADVQYVSIPSNGVWYDHIGIDKERRQAVYKKIHSTVVDNGGKIYDMTDKDYEKYVISDAVHIGWKGWVYIRCQCGHTIHRLMEYLHIEHLHQQHALFLQVILNLGILEN